MNISFDIDIDGLLKNIDKRQDDINDAIKDGFAELGDIMAIFAQDTISSFVNSKGNSQGVDSGDFVASIHATPINGGFGVKVSDGVDYGIHHEFGTVSHWVPFFDRSGNITSLGVWALKHFDITPGSIFRVMGKKGKALKAPSVKSREDVLRDMGGISVKLDEIAPFRKALGHGKRIYINIFEEHINGIK